MLNENIDFENVDEICCAVEDLTNIDEDLLELIVTSISSPLK